ncbi:hypothetical protein Droror1_Dr00001688 [Drosera rotundifolia]
MILRSDSTTRWRDRYRPIKTLGQLEKIRTCQVTFKNIPTPNSSRSQFTIDFLIRVLLEIHKALFANPVPDLGFNHLNLVLVLVLNLHGEMVSPTRHKNLSYPQKFQQLQVTILIRSLK